MTVLLIEHDMKLVMSISDHIYVINQGTPLANGSPEPARTQLGACPNYLPGAPDRCVALTDPRGTGVALGAVDQ